MVALGDPDIDRPLASDPLLMDGFLLWDLETHSSSVVDFFFPASFAFITKKRKKHFFGYKITTLGQVIEISSFIRYV